jgi:hypothetical protein
MKTLSFSPLKTRKNKIKTLCPVDKPASRGDQSPKKAKALIRKSVVVGYWQGAIFVALWPCMSQY